MIGEELMKWTSEEEARADIRQIISAYYYQFKKTDESFHQGDKIPYSGRCFDEKEMESLTDAMLDFWLTSGRFSEKMESKLSDFIGVRFARLVNSGS